MGRVDYRAGLFTAWVEQDAHRLAYDHAPKLSSITLDFGVPGCREVVDTLRSEMPQRWVGSGPRGALMTALGVSKRNENLLIAGIIVALAVLSCLFVLWR